MSHRELTTACILEEFTAALHVHQGVVSDVYDDGNRLFARSILPDVEEVTSGDRVRAGVALRADDEQICVHPYLFRQVCRNGAITAQTIATRTINDLQFLQPDQVTLQLREAVEACCDRQIFSQNMQQMRISAQSAVDMAITMAPLISRLGGAMSATLMAEILHRFQAEGDPSRFGMINAITAQARETRDPALRWNLEDFGGSLILSTTRGPTSNRPPRTMPRATASMV